MKKYLISAIFLSLLFVISTLCAQDQVNLLFEPGIWTVDSDTTIDENITMEVPPGAMFLISQGKTLTINGHLKTGLYQIFSGEGKVIFGKGSVVEGYAEWWGIDGIADDIEINAALSALDKVVGIQDYSIDDTIIIPQGKIFEFNQNPSVSPAGETQARYVITPTNNCTIAISSIPGTEGISIVGTAIDMENMPNGSIGILITSTFNPFLQNIAISNLDDSGNNSIGIKFFAKTQGVYWGEVSNVMVYGDINNRQGTGIVLQGKKLGGPSINTMNFNNIRVHRVGIGLKLDTVGGGLVFKNFLAEQNAGNGFEITNVTLSRGGNPIFIGGETSHNGGYGGQGKCLVINMVSAANFIDRFDSDVTVISSDLK